MVSKGAGLIKVHTLTTLTLILGKLHEEYIEVFPDSLYFT